MADTGHGDTVCTVAFSSDGNLVACGSFDGQLNVWNQLHELFREPLRVLDQALR